MELKKGLLFTDIHWGRKNNSDEHNNHCMQFIQFVCDHVPKHSIDHIIFLGDWYEHRNAVNISTLNWAYNGAKLLNQLNIPIYFIVGNHDMFTKINRDMFSTIEYNEFNNFVVIDKIRESPEIGKGSVLCPFLLHNEYDELHKIKAHNAYGHFEFNGFVLTGESRTFVGGHNHSEFKKFKRIFSGHFHKRQINGNVIYIGNTFPMDFSDANDVNRGFAIHDHVNDDVTFVDWADCPKYIYTTLSDIVNNTVDIPDGANISCVADINIEYSKLMELSKTISETYSLSALKIHEPKHEIDIESEKLAEVDFKANNINDSIITMLDSIDNKAINNQLLIDIYRQL
jgi:DNA repair exonuclease SbcCD nuclease subunit